MSDSNGTKTLAPVVPARWLYGRLLVLALFLLLFTSLASFAATLGVAAAHAAVAWLAALWGHGVKFS